MRRVVTGETSDGKSYVVSDGEAATADVGTMDLDLLWRNDTAPPLPALTTVSTEVSFPPPGGVWVITWTIPAGTTGEDPADIVQSTGERPGFHSTDSVDVNVVLSGEVVLELDDGEVGLRAGDLVVVNGSRHAWQNRSSEPVRVLSTIVGGTRTP
ncbi:cupin domain-containing protein [Pseudonocardia sp. RS11V-5]|uniref:cupin domain-containing protein n=1 Tax=Pseudonocardia terrae TaxID=2905831 RepID=UPI001E50EE59|nr:cupin domain-containing protein [Pseudonocardia terrae]MCE3550852.1 cupin domain-containing protein [Pseudonocardia terrae]